MTRTIPYLDASSHKFTAQLLCRDTYTDRRGNFKIRRSSAHTCLHQLWLFNVTTYQCVVPESSAHGHLNHRGLCVFPNGSALLWTQPGVSELHPSIHPANDCIDFVQVRFDRDPTSISYVLHGLSHPKAGARDPGLHPVSDKGRLREASF